MKKILQTIFSVKNDTGYHKVFTVLGIKMKFCNKKRLLSFVRNNQPNINYTMPNKSYDDKFKYVLPIETIKNIIKNPNIKIISFDIFDTLLYRPCINPTDIFYLIANKVDRLYNIDFIKLRLDAENLLNKPNANIYDIYAFIQKYYKIEEKIIQAGDAKLAEEKQGRESQAEENDGKQSEETENEIQEIQDIQNMVIKHIKIRIIAEQAECR